MFSNHGHQNPTRQRAEQTARELSDQRESWRRELDTIEWCARHATVTSVHHTTERDGRAETLRALLAQTEQPTALALHHGAAPAADSTEPPKHIRDAWERHASEPLFDLYWQDPGCPQWKYNIGWFVSAVGADLRHAATDSYPGVVYNVRLAK